jgi:hypothetical protein
LSTDDLVTEFSNRTNSSYMVDEPSRCCHREPVRAAARIAIATATVLLHEAFPSRPALAQAIPTNDELHVAAGSTRRWALGWTSLFGASALSAGTVAAFTSSEGTRADARMVAALALVGGFATFVPTPPETFGAPDVRDDDASRSARLAAGLAAERLGTRLVPHLVAQGINVLGGLELAFVEHRPWSGLFIGLATAALTEVRFFTYRYPYQALDRSVHRTSLGLGVGASRIDLALHF